MNYADIYLLHLAPLNGRLFFTPGSYYAKYLVNLTINIQLFVNENNEIIVSLLLWMKEKNMSLLCFFQECQQLKQQPYILGIEGQLVLVLILVIGKLQYLIDDAQQWFFWSNALIRCQVYLQYWSGWPRNGYRKLKAVDHNKETESTLLPTAELNWIGWAS